MIFKNIFAQKIGKRIGIFTQNIAKLYKNWIKIFVLRKTQFSPKNRHKSLKLVIVTLTPGQGDQIWRIFAQRVHNCLLWAVF
jgi:hypothetical protein